MAVPCTQLQHASMPWEIHGNTYTKECRFRFLRFFLFFFFTRIYPSYWLHSLLYMWPIKTLDTLSRRNCWSQISINMLQCKSSWKTRVHRGQWKLCVFDRGSFLTSFRVGSLLIWFMAHVRVKKRLEEKQHTSKAQAKKHLFNTTLCPRDGAESSFFHSTEAWPASDMFVWQWT